MAKTRENVQYSRRAVARGWENEGPFLIGIPEGITIWTNDSHTCL